jgi:hypothetical protein
MINSADDIIPLMNLILPPGKKLKKKLSKESGGIVELNAAIAGRVSYIKEDIKGDVPKAVFEGLVSAPLQNFKLLYLAMSPFQSDAYRRTSSLQKKSFDLELQRTALFAFPTAVGRRQYQRLDKSREINPRVLGNAENKWSV